MTWRILHLVGGLVLYGVGCAVMVRAGVGVDPWTVFAQGLSLQTGVGIGWVTNIVGFLVLLLWIPLRQRPGIGTIANILLVGTSMQAALVALPPVDGFALQLLVFVGGMVARRRRLRAVHRRALRPGPARRPHDGTACATRMAHLGGPARRRGIRPLRGLAARRHRGRRHRDLRRRDRAACAPRPAVVRAPAGQPASEAFVAGQCWVKRGQSAPGGRCPCRALLAMSIVG